MTRDAIILTLKFLGFSIVFILAALILRFAMEFLEDTDAQYSAGTGLKQPPIIVDAGHGGEDGGAIGINGVLEKDINLDIALTLRDLCRATGLDVILTREDDRMLYTEKIRGQLKNQDLKNRLLIAEANPDSLFISVHVNTFTSERYSGLQVYYSKNHPDSSKCADIIQQYAKSYIQPENKRETKGAGSNIFLMHRIKSPAVLVECGFISNSNEAELLATQTYKTKLACMIFAASLEHMSRTTG